MGSVVAFMVHNVVNYRNIAITQEVVVNVILASSHHCILKQYL